ncbi:hypothetical protein P175DRAFT_0330449 [Aspergillus ochraceoroseus IBT 24754]|uniref:rRNA biogenesis protein RRP36 n=2 Tax=Aspergillus ochraceoroseus TaxID=138278 RepID=A0A2T5LR28_9EURO|nr:uncharacterized protein P175DRAFT_0330449 [Aspergillus ochraceoroseus IBT 24754]KKK22975.1 hypothetical protein AOCH_003406 [Aspergillus ochraceoroseus]PTU18740.1 hypothetical protein P175DRAFT_0330449 [Aspergillus ochraceoroseus IBT 24754]
MAISDLLNRRMRARPDEDDDGYSDPSGSEASNANVGLSDESGLEGGSDDDDDDDEGSDQSRGSESESEDPDEESDQDSSEEEDDGENDVQASLSNISFGALAKAQASLGPKAKRNAKALKRNKDEDAGSTSSPLDDIRARIQEAREQKRKASLKSKDADKPARSSKHAPAVQSSKYAVSRKRTVIEAPSLPKSRDPRFDPTVIGGRHNAAGPSNAYAFLDDYRASELKEMKEQLAKTKDPKQREALQRDIRSASDRLRTIENNKREKEILADHKKKEKQLIREGKKSTPYFLKKSELKKQVLLKKYESMNSKDRAKALERRRKKAASKEIKAMPMARRGFGGDDAPDFSGSRKRRRVE